MPLSATAHGCFGVTAFNSLSIPSLRLHTEIKASQRNPREEGSFLWLPWKANQNVECSSTKPSETKYVSSAVFIYITQFFFAKAVTWLFSTWLYCIVIQRVQQVSAGEYKMLNLLIAREAANTSIPPETQTHLAK